VPGGPRLCLEEGTRVAADLLRGLYNLLLSPAVLEEYSWACLDQACIRLENPRFSSPPHQLLPALARKNPKTGKFTLLTSLHPHERRVAIGLKAMAYQRELVTP
jgi:hypothetical protein